MGERNGMENMLPCCTLREKDYLLPFRIKEKGRERERALFS